MTDSPDMDLLVKAADNPDQIAPPAANEVRAVRSVNLLYGRGETVYTSNVYELMEAAKEAEAKSYLQQVQEGISNDRLQIKTMTAFGQKNATTIGQARRLNVDLIVMSSHGRSGISRWVHSSFVEKVLRNAKYATLVIREQESVHEEGFVRIMVV